MWMKNAEDDPGHSSWYIERFRTLTAAGQDIVGEARLVDAMVARRSRILDAGCGIGRNGAHLHRAGHIVVGIDVDPALIAAARVDHPGPEWLVGDLAELDLPAHGVPEPFDLILCAGNVMTFLAPSTRTGVLERFRRHLAPGARAVIGFGAGRGYPFTQFLTDARGAGLMPELLLSSWDLRPFQADSEFLVAVLSATTAPQP
jgi:SAM-dependent methyltransferase